MGEAVVWLCSSLLPVVELSFLDGTGLNWRFKASSNRWSLLIRGGEKVFGAGGA